MREPLMSIDDVDSMSIYTHHRFIPWVSEKYHHSCSHPPSHTFPSIIFNSYYERKANTFVTHSFDNKCWQMENLSWHEWVKVERRKIENLYLMLNWCVRWKKKYASNTKHPLWQISHDYVEFVMRKHLLANYIIDEENHFNFDGEIFAEDKL